MVGACSRDNSARPAEIAGKCELRPQTQKPGKNPTIKYKTFGLLKLRKDVVII